MSTPAQETPTKASRATRVVFMGPKGSGKSCLLARSQVPHYGTLETSLSGDVKDVSTTSTNYLPTVVTDFAVIHATVKCWAVSGDIKYDEQVHTFFTPKRSSPQDEKLTYPDVVFVCVPVMMPLGELRVFLEDQTFNINNPKLYPASATATKVKSTECVLE
jgi:hypothetical protein